MRSLKGPLLNEMIWLNKQKQRGLGRSKANNNNKDTSGVSRHAKLK